MLQLFFVGTDESTAREESDRFNIQLPGNQYELIKSVAAVNPNTVVVMQTLGMVEVDQFKDDPNIAGLYGQGLTDRLRAQLWPAYFSVM